MERACEKEQSCENGNYKRATNDLATEDRAFGGNELHQKNILKKNDYTLKEGGKNGAVIASE